MAAGFFLRRYEYVYDDIGAPASITEYDSTGTAEFVTTFFYDNRGRLIDESRTVAATSTAIYAYAYEYDLGGNRTKKLDNANDREWRYTYDIDDSAAYETANNRLMMVEEFSGQGMLATHTKTTWYTYNCAGNVTRVVSRDESGGGFGNGGGKGGSGSLGGLALQTALADGDDGVPGDAGVPNSGEPLGFTCSGTKEKYTATRFGYAKNGQSVTLAMGEEWCWDDTFASNPTTDYAVHEAYYVYDSPSGIDFTPGIARRIG